MQWGTHLFTLALFALCALPLIKMLVESLSDSGSDSTAHRDIWAKPVPAWHFYAKLAVAALLAGGLLAAWIMFMIETFTPDL
ncbi:hypothetical protein [Pantoea sp. CFSAN033090]|uniref:hypothetical protein n=1 Tax=Pantoea sp. CFSAN033090 TaxID=1690502 RepID=UPI0006912DB8|nr:hypothetical protein [Pantoea sp. CFSAN033090]KOA68685.1 hypothetical protein AFL22_19750 [Pantoea sp. CFSAN033090]